MPANKRIYYAIQQVKLGSGASKKPVHGLQSVGITTNFNLEQVFELGQLSLYQNIENIPEIEVTLNKVLDGYPLMYVLATEQGTVVDAEATADCPTLAGRQNGRVDMELGIFRDTQTHVSGANAISTVTCQGMYVSSISYTFPVDGNFTEDVTLVGNSKVWGTATASGDNSFNGSDAPAASQGVNRRQHLSMDNSRFPTQIPGITKSGGNKGKNEPLASGVGFSAHFQNISVSTDLGREPIYEIGRYAPYHRYATFPVEVTSEFEVLAISGDEINASESGYYTGSYLYSGSATVATASDTGCNSARFNLLDQKIYLETCEGTKIYLGQKNKLTSVNYQGGDTGGGNVTVTYSYTNFNDFVVTHSGSFAHGTAASGQANWHGYLSADGYTGTACDGDINT